MPELRTLPGLKNSLTLLITLLITFVSIGATAAETIKIHEPWIRQGPPNAQVFAGYLTIENSSPMPRILHSLTATGFKREEVHQTIKMNGMNHMKHHKSLMIPPHTWVTFAPGSYHLMLIGTAKPLKVGDLIPLSLGFDDGQKITVDVPVMKKGISMNHGSMNHGSMNNGSMNHGSMNHGTMNHGM